MKKLGLGSAAPKFGTIARLCAAGVAFIAINGFATEGGSTAFPPGGEELNAALMPPPGWYGELMFNRYRATRLSGDTGNALLIGFDLTVNAVTTRLAWVKPASVLGSDRWGAILFCRPSTSTSHSHRPPA